MQQETYPASKEGAGWWPTESVRFSVVASGQAFSCILLFCSEYTHIGLVKCKFYNRNWKDIRCELWLAFWWREVCGGDTRLPSLRPGPAPTAQVFSPCQPNPWVLDGCSYLRQKLRKNGFGVLLPSKNLPAPILPLSHLLCIGRLPTETKYCPNSYRWSGRISNHQWQPWSHPDFEQDIELGGTTPLSQASQILRDQGAQFSK